MNAPATAADGRPLMTQRQLTLVFGGLMLALLLAALDQTIVSTALLTIVNQLNPVSGASEMPWVVTAYLLTSTAPSAYSCSPSCCSWPARCCPGCRRRWAS
jgi:hypothetical protein